MSGTIAVFMNSDGKYSWEIEQLNNIDKIYEYVHQSLNTFVYKLNYFLCLLSNLIYNAYFLLSTLHNKDKDKDKEVLFQVFKSHLQ